ncbi:MAG: hypothetical protein DKM50_03620 [Candidatus Margulisiibacteriota bacterium]|nr:MAG: hypothetical protein A2X43_08005 [Candidatus Margulisbacteria bacterium GWD2_39_127]OGI03670.1 MAG: hypothetical protein A2X42_06485 [Candidatus Margulisbacteria bacterium GWF2_38_17]OGI05662.1 MAG: hypothetical protein A2X41_03535 [Candidatus Margulisbacteria bacterium GWE2_39_32]PZM82225.1 MAG: hypothetical protein DKM50_03620 [Candidatus Margulisiibacteriota bacterium]HAR63733.1 hypothetical protein [Candidatus Margulisiibacteriota bacterium]
MKKLIFFIFIVLTVIFLSEYSFFMSYVTGGNKVYLLKGSNLCPVMRHISEQDSKYKETFAAIMQGASSLEKLFGITTAIPKDLKIIDINVKTGIIYLDFVDEFENWQGSATEIRLAVSQLVYTFTEFKEIKAVAFVVEGKKKILVLGGDGYIIDKPLSRKDLSQNNKN